MTEQQGIIDMLDDLNSTRTKLRLATARLAAARRLWSIVAQRQEDSVDVHAPANPPSLPDEDDVPSGGFQ